ncbi:MAG: hypothetical protein ACU0CO_18595 [Shimia sp.]
MLAFIISVAAGFAARHAREPIEAALEGILLHEVAIAEDEALALSVILCLLAACILFALAGSNISPFATVLGGGLGFFAPQIVAAVKARVA